MANFQKTSPSQTVSAIAIFLIAGSLAYTYFVLLPARQTAYSAKNAAIAKNAGLTQDVANLKNAKAQLSQAETAMTNYGVNLNNASLAMPATEELPNLYVEMESLMVDAGAGGLTNPQYTLGPPALSTSGASAQVPVSITASGSYADLKAYITLLEDSLRPIVIDQVSFQAGSQSSSSSTDSSNASPADGYSVNITGSFWSSGLSAAYSTSTTAK